MSTSNAGEGQAGAEIGARTESRIAWLTLVIGAAAAFASLALQRWRWAAGLAIGAILAWLNFCWLRRGLDALVVASTAQKDAEHPRVPIGTYFRAAFRYALIALIAYVIFKFLGIPLVSMVLGFCALGVATIAASVYEVWHPAE
jgi:hypothetical protein